MGPLSLQQANPHTLFGITHPDSPLLIQTTLLHPAFPTFSPSSEQNPYPVSTTEVQPQEQQGRLFAFGLHQEPAQFPPFSFLAGRILPRAALCFPIVL